MPLTVVRRESMHLYAGEPKSETAKSAVQALLRVRRIEEQEIEAARRRSGLTDNEFHAVRFMLQARRDGRPMGPKDLAVMLGVSNASITKLVDSLVEKGDFVRIPHPTDRRAQILEPTEQAARKIDEAYSRFHEVVVRVIDTLPEADAESLARGLDTITDALVAESPDVAEHEAATDAEAAALEHD
jgi:DNA-binding MarR family transcriptional regulator